MSYIALSDWISSFKGLSLHPPGTSHLEKLPNELLYKVILFVNASSHTKKSYLMRDNLPTSINAPKEHHNLHSCLLVSRRLYALTLPLLYRNPQFDSTFSFTNFSHTLETHHRLQFLVQRMDFSSFPGTIPMQEYNKCWTSLRSLRSLSLLVSNPKDIPLLQTALFNSPNLESLSIYCGDLSDSMAFNLPPEGISPSNITTLEFIGLDTAPHFQTDALSTILPRLPNLRALTVSGTMTSNSLKSLADTARIQHLDLNLTTPLPDIDVFFQLSKNPAFESLITLRLNGLVPTTPFATTALLRSLPASLGGLYLPTTPLSTTHISSLQRLSAQLSELSLGPGLTLPDIEEVILGRDFNIPSWDSKPGWINAGYGMGENIGGMEGAVLETMRGAVGICKLRRRIAGVSPKGFQLGQGHQGRRGLKYLNLVGIERKEVERISESVLLGIGHSSLEGIEIGNGGGVDWKGLGKLCKAVGWRVREERWRRWLERS